MPIPNKPLFIRDISWLKFNERVLQEAKDPSNPLYDRLKFLGIYSNNQDEFFRVRVAALNRMADLKKNARMYLEQNPKKILKQINNIVQQQSASFDVTYDEIIDALSKEKIFIKNERELDEKQEEFVKKYFTQNVKSVIIPLMIESIAKLPLLQDNMIYLASKLGSSQQAHMHRYSLIEVPTDRLPRFVQLPTTRGEHHYILLEDIIRFNLSYIFSPLGFDTFSGYVIKVTRDAEFDMNQEEINFPEILKKALKNRKKGTPTRFVYDREIPKHFLDYLLKRLNMTKDDHIIAGGRIHNFKDFINFPQNAFKKNQIYRLNDHFIPLELSPPTQLFDVLRKKDILLNFPYHSFEPIIDLLREAAIDPHVEEINITAYRLAKESKVFNALVNAAKNGKKVCVVLELRARFDEAKNIRWKEKLEEEGVQVFIGNNAYKVHAKLCLIKRNDGFRPPEYFGFYSTGNFNESTAKVYADHCILTSNNRLLSDMNAIFNALKDQNKTSTTRSKLHTIIPSPTHTRNAFIKLINQEIKHAKNGKKAEIIIKLNSLTDEALITKLLEALNAHVKVSLIIRGICCLVPNKNQSKNLTIISIVDHYLEHARVMYFYNNGNEKIFISSADWMARNLDHRIETTFDIQDENIKSTLKEILKIQLSDNVKSRVIDPLQSNQYYITTNSKKIRSQPSILNYLKSIDTIN